MKLASFVAALLLLHAATTRAAVPAARARALGPGLGLAGSSNTTRDGGAGAQITVSQKLLDYIVAKVTPLVEAQVLSLPLPPLSGAKDGVHYEVTNVKLSHFAVGAPTLSFPGSGTALDVDLAGIQVGGTADYQYKTAAGIVKGSGVATFSVAGASRVAADLRISLDAASHKPRFALANVRVAIDQLQVKLQAGVVAWLADLIVKWFRSTIQQHIDTGVSQALEDNVPARLNALVAGLTLTLPLPLPSPYNVASADFSMETLAGASDHLSVGTRGAVVDTRKPQNDFPGSPPPLRPTSAGEFGAHHVTLLVSPFFLNSAAWVFGKNGLLKYLLDPSDVPNAFLRWLETQAIKLVAPGIGKQWPSAKQLAIGVAVNMDASHAPTASVSGGALVLGVPAELDFYALVPQAGGGGPPDREPAFSLECPLSAALTPSLTRAGSGSGGGGTAVALALGAVSCSPLTLKHSDVGDVRLVGVLGKLVNEAMKVAAGIVNKKMGKAALPLPTISGVSLTNVGLALANGAVQVTTDIDWNANGTAW